LLLNRWVAPALAQFAIVGLLASILTWRIADWRIADPLGRLPGVQRVVEQVV
jgi:hypothetical protein